MKKHVRYLLLIASCILCSSIKIIAQNIEEQDSAYAVSLNEVVVTAANITNNATGYCIRLTNEPISKGKNTKELLGYLYFRVWAILTDGIWIGSSIYSINDYINQSDLNALLNSASIEDTYIDEVSLHINNKELYVDTPDTLHIFIFDLYGMEIFSGDIYRPIVIPLDNINSPLIITKYQTSNTIKTKKLLVQ